MKKNIQLSTIAVTLLLGLCACRAPLPAETPTATHAAATPTPAVTPLAVSIPEDCGWWNEVVFYEIFVRSFYDTNGDGTGDFKGLTEKLDYLNDGNPDTKDDLGVGAVWLMPVFPASSYHGYDVLDYRAINPEYGGMEEFKAFLEAAHARGIRVILDLVINHTSNLHPWFIESTKPESPKRDWYIWSDKPGASNPQGGTVWHPLNGQYYYGAFSSSMPDLNYRNPEVTREMESITRYWLEDVGVDGFRIDGARYLIEEGAKLSNTAETQQWFKEYAGFYKGVNPAAMTVGEVWDKTDVLVPYVQNGGLDLVFDFDLASVWVSAAGSRSGVGPGNILARDTDLLGACRMATFLTNHDMDRLYDQVGGDLFKQKAAATLLLTSPGVPFIYYGEEIEMSGSRPDPSRRAPMHWDETDFAGFSMVEPWHALTGELTRNVSRMESNPESLLSFYRTLIHLRNAHPALQAGSFWPVETGNGGVYAALRSDGKENYLILINLRLNPVEQYRLDLSAGPLKGKYDVKDVLNGEIGQSLESTPAGGMDGYKPIETLAPESIFILELSVP